MSICNSPVTVYPTWQKYNKYIMTINHTPANPSFSQTLVDIGGAGEYKNPDTSGNRYYLHFSSQGWSRVQMSSTSPVDLTDYDHIYIDTWCSDSKTTMIVGMTKSRSTWMSSPTGADNADGGTFTGYSTISSNSSAATHIQCNTKNYTGNWYIAIQRLYTNSQAFNYCNVNTVGLGGTTYSYTKRGL